LRPARQALVAQIEAAGGQALTDAGYRQQMEGLREQMTFLSAAEIADTVLFAVQAPAHVNVAELFVPPTNQPW